MQRLPAAGRPRVPAVHAGPAAHGAAGAAARPRPGLLLGHAAAEGQPLVALLAQAHALLAALLPLPRHIHLRRNAAVGGESLRFTKILVSVGENYQRLILSALTWFCQDWVLLGK